MTRPSPSASRLVISYVAACVVGLVGTVAPVASPFPVHAGNASGDGGRTPDADGLGARATTVEPLGIVEQDFSLPVDDVFDLTLALPAGIDATTIGLDGRPAEIVVGIYRDTATRDDVRLAADGRLGRVGDTITVALDGTQDRPVPTEPGAEPPAPDPAAPPAIISRPEPARLVLAIPTESVERTPDALQVPLPGVYPVVVDLRVDGEIVAETITFVHRAPEGIGIRADMSVGLLLGQTTRPLIDDDGVVRPTPEEVDELERLADTLEAMDAVQAELGIGVVGLRAVRIQPATISALATSDPELADRLVPLLEGSEIIASTKLPLDPSTVVRNQQEEQYQRWLREGEDLVLGTAPRASIDRTMYVVDEDMSTSGALFRRTLGTRMLVLPPERYLSTPGNIGGFTDTSQLVTVDLGDGTTIPAAVIDPGLAARLDEPSDDPFRDAVIMAAELLALGEQLQALGLDVRNHGMVVARSDVGVPDPEVFAHLTRLLSTSPGLRLVPPSSIARTTTNLLVDGLELVLEFPETAGVDLTDRLTTISDIGFEAIGVASMLPDDDPIITAWAQVLEALPSTALDDGDVDRMVDGLRTRLDVYRTGVVAPEPFSFTLTGSSSSIPIGLRNTTDTTLRVKVRLSSAKLTFPDGDVVVELPPGQTTELRIPVRARSNGRSGVSLEILTPGTDVPLAPTVVLTARVNALTGLGQLVTGGLLLVLATWWIRHWRLSRKRRLAADHHHRHPANGRTGDGPADDSETSSEGQGTGTAAGEDLAPDAAASSLPPS